MNRDPTVADERYVSQQEANHAFPLPVWCLGILPQPRKVACQRSNSGTLLFINCGAVLLPLLLARSCFRCCSYCSCASVNARSFSFQSASSESATRRFAGSNVINNI